MSRTQDAMPHATTHLDVIALLVSADIAPAGSTGCHGWFELAARGVSLWRVMPGCVDRRRKEVWGVGCEGWFTCSLWLLSLCFVRGDVSGELNWLRLRLCLLFPASCMPAFRAMFFGVQLRYTVHVSRNS